MVQLCLVSAKQNGYGPVVIPLRGPSITSRLSGIFRLFVPPAAPLQHGIGIRGCRNRHLQGCGRLLEHETTSVFRDLTEDINNV